MEFLPSVVVSLQQQVNTAVERLQNRTIIFDSLSDILGPPLESGVGSKATACFLVSYAGVQLLLFVGLGLGFPEEKPEIWIESFRCLTFGGPALALKMVRWSPRWKSQEMARRIVGFLKEELPKLKQHGDL